MATVTGISQINQAGDDSLLLAERRAADIARPPRVSINGILIGALGTAILILLSFMSLSLPNPLAAISEFSVANARVNYNFQLPFAIFLGAFLGPSVGGGAVLAFLLCGLFVLPVFAGGGGPAYIFEPGFGFLLGMMVSTYLTGRMFRRVMNVGKARRMATLFAVALTGVLATYLVAGVYGAMLASTSKLTWVVFYNRMYYLAAEVFVYDWLATIAWLSMVRYARLLFWLILY